MAQGQYYVVGNKAWDLSGPRPQPVTDPFILMQVTAKTSRNTPEYEARRKTQAQTGVPVLAPAFAGGASFIDDAKQRAMAERQVFVNSDSGRRDMDEALTKAREGLSDLSEYERLQNEYLPNLSAAGRMLQSITPTPLQDEAWRRMEQISAAQVRNMRVPGEGPMSDFDARMLAKTTFNPKFDPKANKMYITVMRHRYQDRIEFAKFRARFIALNKTDSGVEELWQQYLDANPLTYQDGQRVRVRDKRPMTWQQFFADRAKYYSNTGRAVDGGPPRPGGPMAAPRRPAAPAPQERVIDFSAYRPGR